MSAAVLRALTTHRASVRVSAGYHKSGELCQHILYGVFAKEQHVVSTVNTILPASLSVVASAFSSVTRLPATVMNCAASFLSLSLSLSLPETNDFIFAVFVQPSIATARSRSHTSPGRRLVCLTSFIIIDFGTSFTSLFGSAPLAAVFL